MGNCCSCCAPQQRRPAYLVNVSPKKQLPAGSTSNPLQPDGKPLPNGTDTGEPLVPIWAQQIMRSPSFLKEETPLMEEPQRDAAPAVVVIEEPLETTTPFESDDDFDFDLPELVGPAGDHVLETKGTSMTLAPTRVEIIEIERELANTPLPPGSDEETDGEQEQNTTGEEKNDVTESASTEGETLKNEGDDHEAGQDSVEDPSPDMDKESAM